MPYCTTLSGILIEVGTSGFRKHILQGNRRRVSFLSKEQTKEKLVACSETDSPFPAGFATFLGCGHLFSQTPRKFSTQKSPAAYGIRHFIKEPGNADASLRLMTPTGKKNMAMQNTEVPETACLGSNPGCHFLAVWPWDSYLTSLCLPFLIVGALFIGLLNELNESLNEKGSAAYVAHRRHSTKVSHIYCPQRIVKRFVVDKIGHEHLPYSYQKKKKKCTWGENNYTRIPSLRTSECKWGNKTYKWDI